MTAKKNFTICATLSAITLGGFFGYIEIFTKGLERLPPKVCSKAVDRSLAISALPATRKATEHGTLTIYSRDFSFHCTVHTIDSAISGAAEIKGSSISNWRKSNTLTWRGKPISVSSGGFSAIAHDNFATVYVRCRSLTVPDPSPTRPRVLIVRAQTIGPTRAKEMKLREILTDFAYQVARHAHKAGKCLPSIDIPDELPRYPSN